MQVHIYLFYVIICIKIGVVFMDFYSSVSTLNELFQKEVRLVNGLRRYIHAEEEEGRHVNQFVKTLLQNAETEINITKPIDNPVDAYHLLTRWVKDWGKCFEEVFCSDCAIEAPSVDFNLTRGIVENRLKGWPSERDINAIVSAMMRLWDMYRFDLHDFFRGKIFEFKSKPFTPEEIIDIANRAEEVDDLYSSIRFLETLLEEIKMGQFPDSKIERTKLARMTAAAYYRNGMSWKSVEILREYVKTDPENQRLKKDFEYFKTKAESITASENVTSLEKSKNDNMLGDLYKDENFIKHYKTLCRGNLKTSKELSKLFCYNKATSIPIYKVKAELINFHPRIFIFHDVISEREINFIQNKSINELAPSTIVDDHKTKKIAQDENFRVSRTAWMNELHYPFLQKLSKRVKLITGLETEYRVTRSNSEQYQVLNYGIGGMYSPHLDPMFTPSTKADQGNNPRELIFSGDRIATFMFYLSDVMYGGATVFPKLKARIPVEKGSAAFWYNLDLKGDVDFKMYHAGCPVLVGSKWVTNKWIREIGQAFNRQCGLRKYTRDIKL